MMGIGTPSSQSRMPRPMFLSNSSAAVVCSVTSVPQCSSQIIARNERPNATVWRRRNVVRHSVLKR
jgi:hypothetical protein